MKNEVHVSFGIWDFEDIAHAEITANLKVTPSKMYVKGERKNPNFNQISTSNAWILNSPLDIYSPFDEQLDELLSIMHHNFEAFESVCKRYYCEIAVAVYIYFDNGESTPALHLSIDQIHRLRQLNVEIDFDLYSLPNS